MENSGRINGSKFTAIDFVLGLFRKEPRIVIYSDTRGKLTRLMKKFRSRSIKGIDYIFGPIQKVTIDRPDLPFADPANVYSDEYFIRTGNCEVTMGGKNPLTLAISVQLSRLVLSEKDNNDGCGWRVHRVVFNPTYEQATLFEGAQLTYNITW